MSVNSLDAIEDMAKEQLPQRLTFGTGKSYKIVIDNISRTKSGFLKDGKYRYQEYSISMQRYFQ
jgi:phage protein U